MIPKFTNLTLDEILLNWYLFQTLLKAEEILDPGVREILAESGAEEFAPILALRGITSKQIVYMKDRELEEVQFRGIRAVINVVKYFSEEI